MVFNSMVFLWIFLPLCLISYFLIKDKYKNLLLVLLSLIFYAWGETKYIILLLITIIINYGMALLIDKQQKKHIKKLLFIIALLFNLGILAYYKYFNFAVSNVEKIFSINVSQIKKVALPLGISFYIFSSISYIFDVYKKESVAQKNIVDMALYITFFPKLLMGPIEQYKDFEKYINAGNRKITLESFKIGISRFTYGLSKKVLIADAVARVADIAFNSNINNVSTPIAWIGALCYMLQIYFDFSGYSDMALGIAKMFGFNLMENFDLPYTSQTITEFWRRWHISLGKWFKNYLYIPLGGNRKGKIRTYINLFIVFIATGIWHGSAWNYLAWGIYNGIFMIIERAKLKELTEKNKIKIINHIYALTVTFFGWIIFRANGLKNAIKYIRRLFINNNNISTIQIYSIFNNRTIFVIAIAILFAGILQCMLQKTKYAEEIKNFYKVIEPICIGILLVLCITAIANSTYNSFVYFKF